MSNKLNFIWCSYGPNRKKILKFVKQIKRSMLSVKKHNNNVDFYIMTDNVGWIPKDPMYTVKSLNTGNSVIDGFTNWSKLSPFLGKIKSLIAAPRGKNIYLDSDVICLQNVEDLSDVLDKYDFLGTPNHNPGKRTSDSSGFRGRKLASSNIPTHFTSIQGGVYAWNSKSDRAYNIFKKHVLKHGKWGKRDDQVSLTKMVWEEDDLNFLMLPCSYNFTDPIIGRYFKARGKAPFYHFSAMRSGSFKNSNTLNQVRKQLHSQMVQNFTLPNPKSKHRYDQI